jgi:YfiH family protein
MNLSFSVGDDPDLVRQNRDRFFGMLQIPQDRLAIPSQVHGATVLTVASPGKYDQCDGLVSSEQDLFLTISVADCLPIFLFDTVAMAVAAVHAGWRGTRLGVLANALKILFESIGSRPENLLAYLGPSAGVCCYEVGEEVAEQFDPAFVTRPPGGKPHLDLKAANRAILMEAGVLRETIEVSAYCTICNPELFHSYRREGAHSGRMRGVLGLMG